MARPSRTGMHRLAAPVWDCPLASELRPTRRAERPQSPVDRGEDRVRHLVAPVQQRDRQTRARRRAVRVSSERVASGACGIAAGKKLTPRDHRSCYRAVGAERKECQHECSGGHFLDRISTNRHTEACVRNLDCLARETGKEPPMPAVRHDDAESAEGYGRMTVGDPSAKGVR